MATAPLTASQQSVANRLTIAHLMLWMAGSALVLAIQRLQMDAMPDSARPLRTALSVNAVIFSLPSGIYVASLVLWLYRRYWRIPGFPAQPGHWLLLVGGFTLLFAICQQLAGWALLSWLTAIGFWNWNVDLDLIRLTLVIGLYAVAGAVGYAVALSHAKDESLLWKIAIVSLLVQLACILLTAAIGFAWALGGRGDSEMPFIYATNFENGCFGLVSLTLIVVAAIADPRRKERDFLHWTGIAVLVGSVIWGWLGNLVVALLQR